MTIEEFLKLKIEHITDKEALDIWYDLFYDLPLWDNLYNDLPLFENDGDDTDE